MKYIKDVLLVIAILLAITMAVLGTHFSDMAMTPFWWNFWIAAGVCSVLALIIGYAILYQKNNK